MATLAQREFCKKVYDAASVVGEISPVFVAAQACLESAWGKNVIGKYNCFGITKGSNWTGKTKLVLTTEVFSSSNVRFNKPESIVRITKQKDGTYRYRVYRLFKDFDTMEECIMEYTRLYKKPGYSDAWPYRKDAREFARRISDGTGSKYATDPNYYKTMCAMIASVEKAIR